MLLPLICTAFLSQAAPPVETGGLLTVAEKSDYTATSRHEEVMAFIDALADRSGVVRRGELGKSVEGRTLPLIILADPPIETAEQAAASAKPVAFAFGNIHAGEVCGKEALLMLAREIAAQSKSPLLKEWIVVFAPIFNADGNERISQEHRPGQNGPSEGMGQRQNAQGLDLNRDYIKLETPEVRAIVRFLNEWNPALIIDTHTTNGSFHQYTITYAGPRNPAGDPNVIEFVRDRMLPEISRRMQAETGYKSFSYGFFNKEKTRWDTYPAYPRFGTPYRGLRNRIAILSEAYSYASYRDRVLATREFVRRCLQYAAEHEIEVLQLLTEARARTIALGKRSSRSDPVAIRHEPASFVAPISIEGFVEETRDGKRVATDRPKRYRVEHRGRFAAASVVSRPYAYLIPGKLTAVIENLRLHGIELHRLTGDVEVSLEVYRLDKVQRAEKPFQNHRLVTIEATPRLEKRKIPQDTVVVFTGQPLGTLAVYLLEPESDDGLTTWNFFDAELNIGADFPVVRISSRQAGRALSTEPLPLRRPSTEQ